MRFLDSNDEKWVISRLKQHKRLFDSQLDSPEFSGFSKIGLALFYLTYGMSFDHEQSLKLAFKMRDEMALFGFRAKGTQLYSMEFGLHIAMRIFEDAGMPSPRYELYKNEIKTKMANSFKENFSKKLPDELFEGAAGMMVLSTSLRDTQTTRLIAEKMRKALRLFSFGKAFPISESYLKPYLEVTNGKEKKIPRVTVGIAHGIAGPLNALSLADAFPGKKFLQQNLCRTLVNIANESTESTGIAPVWPYFESLNRAYTSGWCTGDAAVGFSLLNSAKDLPSPLKAVVVKTGRKVFIRGTDPARWPKKTSTFTFCHGASGLFQMYHRLSDRYSGKDFHKNRYFWFSLLNRSPNEVECQIKPGQNGSDHLTSGLIGVALAMLTGLGRVDVKWDRFYALGQ